MNKRAAVEKIKGANESELIKIYLRTKRNEHFEKIMALYDKKLFNYIVRRIGDAESAKDVYQTVWLKIASSLESYKDENKFSNFLFFVATNACFDHLRQIKKDNENIFSPVKRGDDDDATDFIDNLDSGYENPEQENEKREEKEMIQTALNSIPDSQKDVVLLRTKGLTFKEIAEMKNMSINTVLSNYRYAVEKIKSRIGGNL
jgi:RNA polymerase sigma-70 factor, ECF subfamily